MLAIFVIVTGEKERIQQLIEAERLEEAFSLMVQSFSERLYWVARRFTLSHEDADDLLQDVFTKAWTALPTFRGDSKVSSWLWRITVNEGLNFVRRQKFRAAFSAGGFDGMVNRMIDEDPWFDGTAAERELTKAVAKLPKKQRLVFTLRYYEDLPYEEISEITGTSVGALKASYHLAYEKIKTKLTD